MFTYETTIPVNDYKVVKTNDLTDAQEMQMWADFWSPKPIIVPISRAPKIPTPRRAISLRAISLVDL